MLACKVGSGRLPHQLLILLLVAHIFLVGRALLLFLRIQTLHANHGVGFLTLPRIALIVR